jgi:hypothetical protein
MHSAAGTWSLVAPRHPHHRRPLEPKLKRRRLEVGRFRNGAQHLGDAPAGERRNDADRRLGRVGADHRHHGHHGRHQTEMSTCSLLPTPVGFDAYEVQSQAAFGCMTSQIS